MADTAESLIQQADQLFKTRKLEEAFQFYREAGLLYRKQGQSQKAASCFSQAALCEKIRVGFEPLLGAAALSEMAAQEALKIKDYAFARWQLREAGLLYEREGDFEKYSHCFIRSQNAFLEYLWHIVKAGEKQDHLKKTRTKASAFERLQAVFAAFWGMMSKIVWGYGEKPFNAVAVAFFIIISCAVLYKEGGMLSFNGIARYGSFSEALYLSGVTFSTLGYGDLAPLGWLRFVALTESLSGFIMVPMLVIALTRRYLRVYR